MSACRALGSLNRLLDDASVLVKFAGQDDDCLAISRVSKGTPSTNVGSVTGLLDDAPALAHLAGQDDDRLTVSTVSKGTVSTKRRTGWTDG